MGVRFRSFVFIETDDEGISQAHVAKTEPDLSILDSEHDRRPAYREYSLVIQAPREGDVGIESAQFGGRFSNLCETSIGLQCLREYCEDGFSESVCVDCCPESYDDGTYFVQDVSFRLIDLRLSPPVETECPSGQLCD